MSAAAFADRIEMQNRLFAELSTMFGEEAPLYNKSLLVNRVCNRAVCDLLARVHIGFQITDEQLEKTSGERHGAIRIGRPDEYRWIARFFACFAMEPHNFYDMANVGAKSQPVIATAFRSPDNPEHRVFTSLLLTDYFDPSTRARIEALLEQRRIFSDNARRLIEKSERQGGLDWSDADALIREGTDRIFKWTGKARDHALYLELCDAGFKIAADISCFLSHHLNHLTPNTLCMDLYTAGMKLCFGEMDEAEFRRRAARTLERLEAAADRDHMRLHFRHIPREQIDAWKPGRAGAPFIAGAVDALAKRLTEPDLALLELEHSGLKDTTEGPSWDTPVLLRQDSYRALSEPVVFINPDGSTTNAVHTARFGEIEQRFYATTPAGRELYDRCLAEAEAEIEKDPDLAHRDFDAYESKYAGHFKPFPKTLAELIEQGLVYARYTPTAKGLAARGALGTTDIHQLVRAGHVAYEGLRYEDFLPVSAAGIFASNLGQYAARTAAAERPVYTQKRLEEIMGRAIISSDASYLAAHARSLLETYRALGLLDKLSAPRRAELESVASRRAGAEQPEPVGAR